MQPHTIVNMDIGPGAEVGLIGDAHKLPPVEGAVDAVAMQAVLEHLPNPESAIAEVICVEARRGVLRGDAVLAGFFYRTSDN